MDGRRRLLVHGGGVNTAEMISHALARCRGASTRVRIIADALGKIDVADPDLIQFLTGAWVGGGADDVRLIDINDEARAVGDLNEADCIFLDGGDQHTLLERLGGAPKVLSAIRQRCAAGVLIGGTSAGAAAMSALMIRGGETADLNAIREGGALLAPGIGLWPQAIVDQHFSERRRHARLFSAVLDQPTLLGVGIDEDTFLVLEAGAIEVFGAGNVIVVDARGAVIAPVRSAQRRSTSGVAVSLMRCGDRCQMQ